VAGEEGQPTKQKGHETCYLNIIVRTLEMLFINQDLYFGTQIYIVKYSGTF